MGEQERFAPPAAAFALVDAAGSISGSGRFVRCWDAAGSADALQPPLSQSRLICWMTAALAKVPIAVPVLARACRNRVDYLAPGRQSPRRASATRAETAIVRFAERRGKQSRLNSWPRWAGQNSRFGSRGAMPVCPSTAN